MKKAHLAGARFGRELLKPFGSKLTPARFNLMLALHGKPMRQNDLWKLLGVVRSVVSEMLDSLHDLAWVKSIRAADGRTRLISLTRLGRKLIDLAFGVCIRSGSAPMEVNRALAGRQRDAKPNVERFKASKIAVKLVDYFGWAHDREHDIYVWELADLREYLDWPMGENAYYELRVADEGTIDAPPFEAGDVLAEIEG